MIYYCDTEFTSFNGELLSIALVPYSRSTKPPFYAELLISKTSPVDPWVTANVFPKLKNVADKKTAVSRRLYEYLKEDNNIIVIADWPEDLSHFYNLLCLQPGQMVGLNNITTRLMRTRGWSTADHSVIPHYALEDAFALRNYFEALAKKENEEK